MSFQKSKRIRLSGKKKIALYKKVYERDKGFYIVCGTYVKEGTIPHHEPPRSRGGNDAMENLAILCNYCHTERLDQCQKSRQKKV